MTNHLLSVVVFAPLGGALTSEPPTPVLSHLWTWIQVGSFRADFGFAMDRLSGVYACFVTFVGFLIHLFATGYMHGDRGFYRFFAYLNLFMFMMLTLVLGDNRISDWGVVLGIMLVFWLTSGAGHPSISSFDKSPEVYGAAGQYIVSTL